MNNKSALRSVIRKTYIDSKKNEKIRIWMRLKCKKTTTKKFKPLDPNKKKDRK